MKGFALRIPSNIYEQLKDLSFECRTSMNLLIGRILADYLAKEDKK